MPKKKTHSPRKVTPLIPGALVVGLKNAQALIDSSRAVEARDLLQDLNRRYPNHAEVWHTLADVAYDLHDMRLYESALEVLVKLQPDEPDFLLALAGVYINNAHFALGLQAARRFRERFPKHARAGEAEELAGDLEKTVPKYLEATRLAGPDGLELAALHEQTQILLERGEHREARRAAQNLLARRPGYAPTMNNMSQSYYAEGDIDNAIITARSVLDFEPENVHALGNLVHYAVISGFPEEAQELAADLKASAAAAYQKQMKIAEALTYLGDDAGVLAAFKQANDNKETDDSFEEPLLHHLAAVAAMRLGRVDEAKRRWKQALQLQPGFDLARANLADLNNPVEERHAPWPYLINHWTLPTTLLDLQSQLLAAMNRGQEDALPNIIPALLHKHPEVEAITPILLARGDLTARALALVIASSADTPAMQTALRDFAFSQHGPDALRIQAMQALSKAGLIEDGPARLWIRGGWQEVAPMNYEIYEEPVERDHPPHILTMIEQAMAALHAGDAAKSESLLTQALEQLPDDATILNNLASTYRYQRRAADYQEMIRYLHERHPDYFFGRANMAHVYLDEGQPEEARKMLEPLLKQRRLHISEFSALAGVQIELLLAEEEAEGAEKWLQMWEQIAPDNPNISILRNRIKVASLTAAFAKLTAGFKNRRKPRARTQTDQASQDE